MDNGACKLADCIFIMPRPTIKFATAVNITWSEVARWCHIDNTVKRFFETNIRFGRDPWYNKITVGYSCLIIVSVQRVLSHGIRICWLQRLCKVGHISVGYTLEPFPQIVLPVLQLPCTTFIVVGYHILWSEWRENLDQYYYTIDDFDEWVCLIRRLISIWTHRWAVEYLWWLRWTS